MNRLTRHGAVGAVVAAMFAAVGSIALAPPAGASTASVLVHTKQAEDIPTDTAHVAGFADARTPLSAAS